MTREEARKAAEVMKAYAEGKEIEFKAYGDERWKTFRYGKDRFLCFNFDRFEYRIKPEPTYRPFRSKEECWQEMQKHQPFGWVKRKEDGCFSCVISVDDTKLYDNVYKTYTFVDGTPFGVKE